MWKIIMAVLIGCTVAITSSNLAAQDIDNTFRNQSPNPVTGALLGEKNEWIWVRESGEPFWRKLIPGRCPEWSLDGKRFYFFLDVGYDGDRAELWSANADGEARLRLTQSDYFIAHGPVVVSPDNHSLAFFYRESRAGGDYKEIVVVDFISSPAKSTEGRVVFKTKASVDHKSLKWKEAGRLSVVVDGARTDIDVTVPSVRQSP